MTIKFVANQTFGGAGVVGMQEAGDFELVSKQELPGGFGTPIVEANRFMLGWGEDWTADTGSPEEWPVHRGAVVISSPPCSGFSVMSNKAFRGTASKINTCMWAATGYAAAADAPVFIMESVTQAFWTGLPLMRQLRDHYEAATGRKVFLTHVLHDAFACGNAQVRKRYFMVLSHEPFDIRHVPRPRWAPNNLREVIGDLELQPESVESQGYKCAPDTRYQARQRSLDLTVDGHFGRIVPATQRLINIADEAGGFNPGDRASDVVTRYYDKHGEFPPGWAHKTEKFLRLGRNSNGSFNGMGFNELRRAKWDETPRTVTGNSIQLAFHPSLERTLTHRELARIMGFPDDFRIEDVATHSGLPAWWGKQTTVDSSRWMGQQIRHHISGTLELSPHAETTTLGPREVVYDESRGERGFDRKKYEKKFEPLPA